MRGQHAGRPRESAEPLQHAGGGSGQGPRRPPAPPVSVCEGRGNRLAKFITCLDFELSDSRAETDAGWGGLAGDCLNSFRAART